MTTKYLRMGGLGDTSTPSRNRKTHNCNYCVTHQLHVSLHHRAALNGQQHHHSANTRPNQTLHHAPTACVIKSLNSPQQQHDANTNPFKHCITHRLRVSLHHRAALNGQQ